MEPGLVITPRDKFQSLKPLIDAKNVGRRIFTADPA
jgi:hypothetical protein